MQNEFDHQATGGSGRRGRLLSLGTAGAATLRGEQEVLLATIRSGRMPAPGAGR